MTEVPKILLAHHLRTLKLPTFLREGEEAELVEIGAAGSMSPSKARWPVVLILCRVRPIPSGPYAKHIRRDMGTVRRP
ncbi:hypothetical protein CDZ95_27200 [Mameliella alba]|nr:hypothetical protein CDZ95_27200 [Mameliella alba]